MRSNSRSRSPTRNQDNKSKKLYIANLPEGANNSEITSLFEEFGDITDVFVKNKDTFSFAFVEFSSIHQAEKALKGMNQTEYKGKTMKIDYSRPRPPRTEEGGGNRGGDRGGGQRNGSNDRDMNGGYNRDRSRSRDNDFKQRGGGGGGGGRGGNNGGGDRPKGCFNCGQNGHFSKQCTAPRKPRDFNNGGGERRDFNNGGNRNFGGGNGDRFGGNQNGGQRENRQEGGGNYRNNRSPVDRGSPVRNNKPVQDMDY